MTCTIELNNELISVTWEQKRKYKKVLGALRKAQDILVEQWMNLEYRHLNDPCNYDIKKCTYNLIVNYNENLYISMKYTVHASQRTAAHFLEREQYELAIRNFWQSYLERKFKNIIYRYGVEYYDKDTNGDSVENHDNYEQKLLKIITDLIAYIRNSDNPTNIANLERVKEEAAEILKKEGKELGKFKPPKKKIKATLLDLYKVKLCKNFMKDGSCHYGDKCNFAHGHQELRLIDDRNYTYKTRLCKYFEKDGYCSFGEKCIYAHGIEELKHAHQKCNSDFSKVEDFIKKMKNFGMIH